MTPPCNLRALRDIKDLQKGDEIIFKRNFFGISYNHYGYYKGDGKVIHFVPNGRSNFFALFFPQGGIIKDDNLLEVAGRSPVEIRRTQDSKRNHDEIMKLKEMLLENPTLLPYQLKVFNCEAFLKFFLYNSYDPSEINKDQPVMAQLLLRFVPKNTRMALNIKKQLDNLNSRLMKQ